MKTDFSHGIVMISVSHFLVSRLFGASLLLHLNILEMFLHLVYCLKLIVLIVHHVFPLFALAFRSPSYSIRTTSCNE